MDGRKRYFKVKLYVIVARHILDISALTRVVAHL